jgi:hypothetical protein
MAKAKRSGEKKEVAATLMGGILDREAEIAKLETERPEVFRLIGTGQIIADITAAKRTVDEKKYEKQYLRLCPTDGVGVLALQPVESTWKVSQDKDGKDTSDFDGPCWVKDFFYGHDLGVKNRESQRLAVLVEGPDKAKEAAAKQLAKAWNISVEEAARKIELMSAGA